MTKAPTAKGATPAAKDAPAQAPLRLFDIGTEFLDLEAAMMETGGEWTPELEERFGSIEKLEGTQKSKVDGYISLIQRSELEGAPLEAQKRWHNDQAKAIGAKLKARENFRTRLKARILEHMERLGLDRLAGSVWGFARHKSSTKREIAVTVPVEQLPESCRTWVPPRTIEGCWEVDEDALRKELLAREAYLAACEQQGVVPEAGALDGKAAIGPQAYHVKIN